ncbi:retrotransposon-related protein [Tanacetum coccineum]
MKDWPTPKTLKRLRDASRGRIGAVLHQDGHLIAFLSKTLSPKHQFMSTYEKEFLAVLMALDRWKGYKKGSDNIVADALSRSNLSAELCIVLRINGRLMVGNDEALKKLLFSYFYESTIGGHSGFDTTIHKLDSLVYYKGIRKSVKQWVRECDIFQRNNPDLSASPGQLQPLPIHDKIWSYIYRYYLITSNFQGKTAILVVVDTLTKYAYFIALVHPCTASAIAQIFLDHICKLHG